MRPALILPADLVLFTCNENHTTYMHPYSALVHTWSHLKLPVLTTYHTQTQVWAHTRAHIHHWLTPFKELFRYNQEVPIPHSTGKIHVLHQPLQLLRRQRLLVTKILCVPSQTEHHMQVTVSACFGKCSL